MQPGMSYGLITSVIVLFIEAMFVYLLCSYGSNVAAGRLFGIPLRGTHSHAFVSSFMV